jgi:hypothetical protein
MLRCLTLTSYLHDTEVAQRYLTGRDSAECIHGRWSGASAEAAAAELGRVLLCIAGMSLVDNTNTE